MVLNSRTCAIYVLYGADRRLSKLSIYRFSDSCDNNKNKVTRLDQSIKYGLVLFVNLCTKTSAKEYLGNTGCY